MNRRKFIWRGLGAVTALLGGGGAYTSMTNNYYSGPVSDHFDGTRFFVPGHEQPSSLLRLLQWRFGNDPKAVWPEKVPSPFADTPPERSTALRVTLIGHASFLIQVAGLNILTDPVYSERASPFQSLGPKRANPPGIALDALPPIDLVLVSHAHYDHLDVRTLALIEAEWKPRFLCPLGNDGLITGATGEATRVSALDWGQSLDAGAGVTVHLTPSYHWSARGLTDRRKQLWCSFVLTTPAGVIYHIADTGYADGALFRDMQTKFGAPRLALIPIGAYEPRWFMKGHHVNPEEAVQIMKDCGAEQAIGHHWGTFQLTNEGHDQPEKDLATALAAAQIAPDRFRAFRPGQVWT